MKDILQHNYNKCKYIINYNEQYNNVVKSLDFGPMNETKRSLFNILISKNTFCLFKYYYYVHIYNNIIYYIRIIKKYTRPKLI